MYSCLSEDNSKVYEKVKEAILKAYELVPEAYRLKFRKLSYQSNQTYVEFARAKERLFEEWCRSEKVNNLDSLKQLILGEEFKKCFKSDKDPFRRAGSENT